MWLLFSEMTCLRLGTTRVKVRNEVCPWFFLAWMMYLHFLASGNFHLSRLGVGRGALLHIRSAHRTALTSLRHSRSHQGRPGSSVVFIFEADFYKWREPSDLTASMKFSKHRSGLQ